MTQFPAQTYKVVKKSETRAAGCEQKGLQADISLGAEVNMPMDHAPQWGGVWTEAWQLLGKELCQKLSREKKWAPFSPFNEKTVHQVPLLRWCPGGCVLLEFMCLKFSVDALHSIRDRGELRETRLSSWNLQSTVLSLQRPWEMFAFASEGPRGGPWCLSTSGPQAVFSKLSTS